MDTGELNNLFCPQCGSHMNFGAGILWQEGLLPQVIHPPQAQCENERCLHLISPLTEGIARTLTPTPNKNNLN